MFISKFTLCNGLKYHKIRYKSRGNNPIRPFQFQFTCVSYVFLLVISFINKLWLLEMYLLKGAKSALSGEMKLFLPACSTPRNIGTRNTGTSRNIPEHPKNPEHPKKPGTLPRKPGTPPKKPEIAKSRWRANMLPRA